MVTKKGKGVITLAVGREEKTNVIQVKDGDGVMGAVCRSPEHSARELSTTKQGRTN
jgi:hypothetical protein